VIEKASALDSEKLKLFRRRKAYAIHETMRPSLSFSNTDRQIAYQHVTPKHMKQRSKAAEKASATSSEKMKLFRRQKAYTIHENEAADSRKIVALQTIEKLTRMSSLNIKQRSLIVRTMAMCCKKAHATSPEKSMHCRGRPTCIGCSSICASLIGSPPFSSSGWPQISAVPHSFAALPIP